MRNAIISSHNSFFIKPFLISQNIEVMKSNDDFEYIKVGLGKPLCTNSNCYDQPTADNLYNQKKKYLNNENL